MLSDRNVTVYSSSWDRRVALGKSQVQLGDSRGDTLEPKDNRSGM